MEELGEGDPFGGLLVAAGSTFEAIGDVQIIFDKLEKVSPDDIQPDVAKIRDSLQAQVDNAANSASDPLGGLLGGLASGLTSVGSWERVNTYVIENCDGG